MIGLKHLAALAALIPHGLAAQPALEAADLPPAIDSAPLAAALDGRSLELSMRGTSVTVLANATPAEDGCAALLTVQAPGSGRIWTRLLRWSELAWVGASADGTTTLSFFEEEGRLPADRVRFRAPDHARFAAEVRRVAQLCRSPGGQAPSAIAGRKPGQGCHFAHLPALQLHESAGLPPRAVLSVYARETPEGELQLLVEQASDRAGSADDWDRPMLAFTFADPRLKDFNIAAAKFALDGKPVAAEHALAVYGDTRLRITMDPFRPATLPAKPGGFFQTLAARQEATLTLLDRGGKPQTLLNFEVGPALAEARQALSAAKWSCMGAAPPPPAAAVWRPED